MAPTLSSASSPGPTSKRKHRGRLIIGALAALSGLLLWGVLAVTQGTRVEKSGPDEATAPAHAAAQGASLRAPPPQSPAPPPVVAPPVEPVTSSEATARPAPAKEAAPVKEALRAQPSRALPAAAASAPHGAPVRTPKKKAHLAAADDPLADQK